MRPVNSQVLGDVARILQLSGAGSAVTELEDGILQQSIDVAPMVRRGGTVADTSGIYTAKIRNDHLGEDTIETLVNLYTLEDSITGNPVLFRDSTWPNPVPRGLEVWLLEAYAIDGAGGGGNGGGRASIIYDSNAMAWRTDDTNGVPQEDVFCFWSIASSMGAGSFELLTNNIDGALPAILTKPKRIRRSADPRLLFQTGKTDVGAGVAELRIVLGLFPVGLGQDVIG